MLEAIVAIAIVAGAFGIVYLFEWLDHRDAEAYFKAKREARKIGLFGAYQGTQR
jgi:hypothetical protein